MEKRSLWKSKSPKGGVAKDEKEEKGVGRPTKNFS
jgi:hypothetical protein